MTNDSNEKVINYKVFHNFLRPITFCICCLSIRDRLKNSNFNFFENSNVVFHEKTISIKKVVNYKVS